MANPSSTSPITATSGTGTSPKWTVMVFMGAATFGGSEPLLQAAESDIAEIEDVGSGGNLEIFIQEHGRGKDPRRCHVSRGAFQPVMGDAADPRGGKALEEFIVWSLGQAAHDPNNESHYSLLVLWGHSYDFAFGRERLREGEIDALDFAELSDVLRRLRKRFGRSDAKLDVVGFDSCDLATVELACQLEPFAKYLVGSQVGIPLPGWPYDRVLMGLRTSYGRTMGPAEFGSWAVRRYCEAYPPTDPVSLSALDLRSAADLSARAAVLAATLDRTAQSPAARAWLADLFYRSQTDDERPYVDVADLCLTLVRESDDALIREAARALGDFLLSPKPPLSGLSESGEGRPFVVEHGRNAGSAARLNGISLYAPHLVRGRDFEGPRSLYHNFDFVQRTRWSDLVHTLARLV